MLSVALFLAAIFSALAYFTIEDQKREKESVVRDLEYGQQRLRLRLLERQEQIMRIARDLTNREIEETEFGFQAKTLVALHPEVLSLTWVSPLKEVVTGYAAPSAPAHSVHVVGQTLKQTEAIEAFAQARKLQQSVYSRVLGLGNEERTILLVVPLGEQGRFSGAVLAEYSLETLLGLGVPSEVLGRYAVSLVNAQGQVLAGKPLESATPRLQRLPWATQIQSHQLPVTPIGEGVHLRGAGFHTGRDSMGESLFWVVGALSALTVWMLVASMRHSRRRLQAQRALQLETHFRRAMENSMLTGMRAMDNEGRITYVNQAFCNLTGWSSEELIGTTPPYPYWPDGEHSTLMARLYQELQGQSEPGGFEVPIKRKNGNLMYARMYVSPLVDGRGQQTGWMTSMTDITEPKRIREELTAAHERFTTVLESLDDAISVAPLNRSELLFANRAYRQWFGATPRGHRNLIEQASALPYPTETEGDEQIDGLAGLPTDTLLAASADNAQILVPHLNRWFEVRTRYLTWVDGRLAQMVIATDITARRQAEEQSNLQAKRAENASRLITMGEMASSVAHELNQPLTAISNYSSGMIARLKRQQISEEELLGALEKTVRQAQRAGQIIQRIRAFVKRSEPHPTLSSVTQMVHNATELAELELRRHLIRLHTHLSEPLPDLLVDPILIEQVVINLLKNSGEAIAHANLPSSRRQVELNVKPLQLGGREVVQFRITDSGPGIPEEQLEHIFEAFYSTKEEGMGIGLKLCRSIIESHQGQLQARNLYNLDTVTGCEFSFWIPAPVNT